MARLRMVINTSPSILELLFNGFTERINPRKKGTWHTDEEWDGSFAEAQIAEFSRRGECIVREKITHDETKTIVGVDNLATPNNATKKGGK